MDEASADDRDEQPTERQVERARKTIDLLTKLGVPTYWHPLYVDDDEDAELRTPIEVAHRALVLWMVARAAERVIGRKPAASFLRQSGLWDFVSPHEQAFLEDEAPDARRSNSFVWRLEALVALLWALGHLDALYWPDRKCDRRLLKHILQGNLTLPSALLEPRLRPKSEILDEQNLALKQHWAVRNTMLKSGLPSDLIFTFRRTNALGFYTVFSKKCRLNMGVVAERHHALNWLSRYPSSAGWDDVDTPT
jgi:hypothetical protein